MSLRKTAETLSASVGGSNEFADALVDAAPEVKAWLRSCSPSPDCPLNPKTDATDAEIQAWIDAHTIKQSAAQATTHHKKLMAHHIKKRHRKSGDPIREDEAESIASNALSLAQTKTQAEIASDLLE